MNRDALLEQLTTAGGRGLIGEPIYKTAHALLLRLPDSLPEDIEIICDEEVELFFALGDYTYTIIVSHDGTLYRMVIKDTGVEIPEKILASLTEDA